ncbi:MAG: malate dehydrogenase [Coriobacteriales bacterium]|jgi:malate dehydrogenase|nr:malate dehydrogenase [Coriobacteriales bacterium]
MNNFPKVTVVGAGNVGATTALLLLLKDLANVVLIDVAEGVAKGKALDLMHMRSNERFGPTITGTGDYGDTAASDIVVVTAGVPRKPGMTREDLLEVNAGIVRQVIDGALAASPNAVFIFVTNPLDVMTNLAARLSGLPKQRLMGMGGVLDSARFAYAIAQETGLAPTQIEALVVGAHGEAMVPLPRLSTAGGIPITSFLDADKVERVVANTVTGGAAVVELLQTGSAFYAPASSIVLMVEAILQDSGRVLSTCAKLEGEYGINDVYMCVPARLGKSGVQEVVEIALNEDELIELRTSASVIKAATDAL